MAYYFVSDGWDDILVGIAYNPREYSLYERLAEKCSLQATVSCPDSAAVLAGQCRFPLEVMVKIDTGYDRSGIRWDDTGSLRSCLDHLSGNDNIRVRGLMTHDGSTYGLSSKEAVAAQHKRSVSRIISCRNNSGRPELMISTGDTPSASLADDFEGIDELRPGNFIFYDLMQYITGACRFEEIATALLCPVIDIRPGSDTVVIHGGAVHLSKDSILVDGKRVYGMLAGLDSGGWHRLPHNIYLSSLSQEHGIIDCSGTDLINTVHVGDLVAVIPVHSCLSADCMGGYMSTDGEYAGHMKQPAHEIYSLL